MKFLKILFIVLLVLFGAILAIPVFFKSQLMEIAKEQVNKNVKAKVDWEDFSVSLFKGFPDLKVSLKKMSVLGTGVFEDDTLVAFDDFSVKVDLFSAFSGNIKVKSVILNRPVMRAIALQDGSVNWDIAYPSEETEEPEEDTAASGSSFSMELREFRIDHASISYYDEVSAMFANLVDYNLELSGNFSETLTDLNLNTYAQEVTVDMEGIKYLKRAFFSLEAILGADLENMSFEIRDNLLKINDISLGLEGVVRLPEDADADLDVSFFTRETSFKSLLSMIPAIYMKDFEDLKTSGTLKIDGTARGLVKDDILPRVDLNLLVNDAYFSYPDLPESVDNITIDLKVFYDGSNDENTTIDLNKFHMEMAGNPVDIKFHARNLVDLHMNGSVVANIDLARLKNAIPLEDMALQGKVNANIEMMGKLSDIENENYEAFKADGLLEILDVVVEGEDLPAPVNLEKASLLFSPKYVNLTTLDARLGASDFHLDGRLENFIPYVFEDGVVRGELNFTSNYLNISELIPEGDTLETGEVEDTVAMAVVEIPSNIDFKLKTSLEKVLYDKLELNNIAGTLWVKDSKMQLDMLKMDLLEGSMMVNGEYNTQDPVTPFAELGLDMKNIDIESSFNAFNTVEKLVPLAEKCRGNVSAKFDFVTFLDPEMNPILNTMVGRGRLMTEEVKIEDNETFTKIGKLLKKEDLAQQKFKDVDLSFEMREGRVFVKPFDTKIGTSKVKIGGSQGIDQTMDYDLDFSIPRNEFGNAANDLLEDLAAKATAKGFKMDPGENVNVSVKVVGNFSDPELKLDVRESMASTRTQVQEALQERVEEEIEKVKEEVRENVSEEVDKIMKQAEEEAAKVRQAAEDAGEALIGEAKLRKKQLVKEAGSNPVKKLAAERTGDGLISTAEKQAEKLRAEADEKAEAIMNAARKRADEIKSK